MRPWNPTHRRVRDEMGHAEEGIGRGFTTIRQLVYFVSRLLLADVGGQ